MVRINSIGSVNNYPIQISFKAKETQSNPQINQLQETKPDFSVKTPMSFSKIKEISLPYNLKAHFYKLSNGQKVVIVPQEGKTVLQTYVNSGSMNENDNIRGISHYIEHNLFNGSEGLEEGDFFKQVDKMGASTNASTGFAETNYFISSNLLNENDLENKIKLHASMLETPLFAIEKLQKEKDIVNSEINMITSEPENIAINKMLKNLYGIKTTSTDIIGGTTENITRLTREDVVNYFNNNYYPQNMVTVVTGDVKPDETMNLISKYFSSKKQPPQNKYLEKFSPTQKAVREDLISDKANAATIVVGFNTASSNNTKDRIYSEALLKLLSMSSTSRINKQIKQFNTSSFCEQDKISTNPSDGRVAMFLCECSEENSEKVLKKIFTEIGNISNNPPTDDEMLILKKNMLNNFSSIFEQSFDTNNIIGKSILENNEEYLNDFEKVVKAMTKDDLVNVSKKYFDVNKASVAVVHPSSATFESIKENHKNVSFTGKTALNLNSVKEYEINNNYRVATINSNTNNVNLLFSLSADDFYYGKPSAHLVLNKILNEGSIFRNQEDLHSDLAKNGIEASIGADFCSISSTITCNSEDSATALKSLKEVVENPRFTEESFIVAKNLLKEEITNSDKSAFDKLDNELFKGLPVGYSKQEILKDLESLTLDDVKANYDYIIKNGKGKLTVSAPFEKKLDLKKEMFKNISEFRPVERFCAHKLQDIYKPVENTKVLTDIDFKNQAEIVQAYKFKVNENIKDKITLSLLNTILGGNPSSRLFMDLREKEKLAYHVRSNYETNNNIGLFALKIKTTTDNKETGEQSFDNVQKSVDGFKRHIEKLMLEKVTEEELNNAKLSLKNAILDSNHSGSGKVITMMQGMNSPYGLSRVNKLYDEIDKITSDDILNAAKYIFSGKPIYSVLASEDTLNANAEYFKQLEK